MIRPAKIWILVIVLTVVSTISARADCPIGDLSGDCQVGLEDLDLFVGKWLDDSDNLADLNGDGRVDMADFSILAENWGKGGWLVVINEIHYNPDVETELVEFVELYNAGVVDANISGWYFSNGISYTFPPGTILPPDTFIVVAEDPMLAYRPVNFKVNMERFPI